MLPNEDLKGGTKDEMLIFDAPFNGVNALILGDEPWNVHRAFAFNLLLCLSKSSFGSDMVH